jgi:hypothetical protein
MISRAKAESRIVVDQLVDMLTSLFAMTMLKSCNAIGHSAST